MTNRLLQPISHGAALAWLALAMSLSVWAIVGQRDTHSETLRLDEARSYERCVENSKSNALTNQNATDLLETSYQQIQQMRTFAAVSLSDPVRSALNQNQLDAQDAFDRRLAEVPAPQRKSALEKLKRSGHVEPPIIYAAITDCAKAFPRGPDAFQQIR